MKKYLVSVFRILTLLFVISRACFAQIKDIQAMPGFDVYKPEIKHGVLDSITYEYYSSVEGSQAVSYIHLDVYKRQV